MKNELAKNINIHESRLIVLADNDILRENFEPLKIVLGFLQRFGAFFQLGLKSFVLDFLRHELDVDPLQFRFEV